MPSGNERTALLAALENAVRLSPRGLLSVRATPAAGLTPDILNPISAALAAEPEFQARPKMVLRQGMASIGFSPPIAARLLATRTAERGTTETIAWLDKLLATQEAVGLYITLIEGVEIQAATTVWQGIEIVPVSDLPPSSQRESLQFPYMLPGPGTRMRFQPPAVALVSRSTIMPLLIDDGGEPMADTNIAAQRFLIEEICILLTLFGPSGARPAGEWFQFEDPELALVPSGVGWRHDEIDSLTWPRPVLDLSEAPKLIEKYMALDGSVRRRVKLATQRLNQAIRRRNPGDRAVELSIALETLLADGEGEFTWKIGFRSALLSAATLPERLINRSIITAVYKLRSLLMHTGESPPTIAVKHVGKKEPSANVITLAAAICGRVICAIIERGHIPNWHQFELNPDPAN